MGGRCHILLLLAPAAWLLLLSTAGPGMAQDVTDVGSLISGPYTRTIPLRTSATPLTVSGMSSAYPSATGNFPATGDEPLPGTEQEQEEEEEDNLDLNPNDPAPSAPGAKAFNIDTSQLPGTPGAPYLTPPGAAVTASINFTVRGINALEKRLSNGGNSLDVEPPDQALCVGAGFLVEVVNAAFRVRSAATGDPLTDVIQMNTFFGYPPEYVASPRQYGPYFFDPVCLFDADTQRFFLVMDVYDKVPASGLLVPGSHRLEIAVSQTSDPRGLWYWYRIPTNNNGITGPLHRYPPNWPAAWRNSNTYFWGDYPQIGHDAYGFYISTNEFATWAPTGATLSNGGNVYAISKRALAQGAAQVQVTEWFIVSRDDGKTLPVSSSTIMPTKFPSSGPTPNTGVAYFLNSWTGLGPEIYLWALNGTNTLDTPSPTMTWACTLLKADLYIYPFFRPVQKNAGGNPLGQSGAYTSRTPASYQPLDGGDSRMQSVWYAAGKLWVTFQTAATDAQGQFTNKVGAMVLQIMPDAKKIQRMGVLTAPYDQTSLLRPNLAVNSAGNGAITFTVTGPNNFPSHGYAAVDNNGIGQIVIANPGMAAQDGFTEYVNLGRSSWRPRWGDYGAAAVDEAGAIYLASEYIADTACSVTEFLRSYPVAGAPVGACSNTRTFYANWATSIVKLDVKATRGKP